MDLLNEIEDPARIPRLITDDFRYQDRRRGGFSFPSHDSRARFDFVRSVWDVAEGSPRLTINDVVATRGQRLAVALWQLEYPQGQVVDYLDCWQLDPTLSLHQVHVTFDVDDLDEAMAELDHLDRKLKSS